MGRLREPRLSGTDALLSIAAAITPQERHTARLALIATGPDLITRLDTTGLITGDGTAGRHLLGLHGTLAARSTRIPRPETTP